jgi:hypothetical protein
MCPACIAAALVALGAVSGSGYVVKKKLRPKRVVKRRMEAR